LNNFNRCDGGHPLAGMLYTLQTGITEGSKYKYQNKNGRCEEKTDNVISGQLNGTQSPYFLPNACMVRPDGNEKGFAKFNSSNLFSNHSKSISFFLIF
jgi:hypothetical protein